MISLSSSKYAGLITSYWLINITAPTPRIRSCQSGTGKTGRQTDSIQTWTKGHTREILSKEFRRCVKVEVAVLGSPSLIVRTVSVDVKQH